MDYKYFDVLCSCCSQQYGKCVTCGRDIRNEYGFYCDYKNHMCEECHEGTK
jgi:hypothetical protein